MSIVKVRELFTGQSDNDSGKLDYKREFLVESNTEHESIYQIEHASVNGVSIPGVGSYYSCNGLIDFGAICLKVTSKQDKEVPKSWNVICNYKPRPTNNNNQKDATKPTNPPTNKEDRRNRFPSIKIDTIEREVLKSTDIKGISIESSTYEPIWHTQKFKNQLVTISFWSWFLSYETWRPYQNSINTATFWDSPAHTWKLNITADADYEADGDDCWRWWHMTYVFEQKYYLARAESAAGVTPHLTAIWQTWDEWPIDQGRLVMDPRELGSVVFKDKLVPARDMHGNAVREKVLLDGAGRQIGSPNSQCNVPVFVGSGPFRIFEEKNFAALPYWIIDITGSGV